MRTLVTGATGCLGALLADWLVSSSHDEVWCTGRSPCARERYVRCDLRDAAASRRLIAEIKPDRVFHLAGSFTGEYELDVSINVDGARHLFDAILAHQLSTRVIVTGSAAEYGRVGEDESPLREDQPLRPASIYGLTKAYQTLLAHHYAAQHSLDIVVARLFNLLAPGLSDRLFPGRVERQIDRLKRGEISHIETGNLSSARDYVSATEAIEQLHLIATRGKAGNVYHVASGRAVPIKDLLQRLLAQAGFDMTVVRESIPSGDCRVYDAPSVFADMTKTRLLLRSTDARDG